ncbi:MAG: tripartite tricarboxylate transporter TctB family protein [Alphaproteobacteria bacterium]
MRFNDAIPGALFLILAILAFVEAGSFPSFPGVPYGPDLFPRIIAVMMGGGGLLLVFSGLRSAGRAPWLSLADWARDRRSFGIFAAVVGSVLFYVLVSEDGGFILTGWLMLIGLYLVTRGRRRIVSSMVLTTAVIGLTHIIFVEGLRVPLPFGVIERLIAG